jgi:two-component system catabolic regulation response regulator CreB
MDPLQRLAHQLDHDAEQRVIRCGGKALDLSRNEYHLLVALMSHPGRVLSRDQLMEMAWPDPGAASDRTVDAHVKSVRSKIRAVLPEFDPIETRRGMGYAFRR